MKQESPLGQLVYNALNDYFEQHRGNLPTPGLYKRVIAEVERPLLFLTLKAVDGNQQKAALVLGINRNTLRKKLKEQIADRNEVDGLQDRFASMLKDL